jgi:ribosomal protein S18 acetylase RimI-like enzyme
VRDDYFIRAATGEDAPGILNCLAAAFEPYRNDYSPGAWTDTVLNSETIQERLASMQIFVAVSQDGIVGTIACGSASPDEGHLRGMAVLPKWHGHGVAEALLEAAEAELATRGCQRITLDTTEPLQRAMRFYEKHGYQKSGTVTDFFGMRLHEYVKNSK